MTDFVGRSEYTNQQVEVTQNPLNTPDELKVLIELYKASVEEYRFQVSLNWDRNKFYVLLNSGLITANCGLLRLPGFKFAEFLTAPLFVLGFLTGWLGYKTLRKGIEYRRRAIVKKAEVEKKLSAYSDVIPIDTTAGMREVKSLLGDSEKYIQKPLRPGTINYFLATLFVLLMGLNAIALIYLVVTSIDFSIFQNLDTSSFTDFIQRKPL